MQNVAFGVHLPVMRLGEEEASRKQLLSYSRKAEDLGFDSLSVNDHVLFRTDWLDSLATLASVAGSTGKIRLGTSILKIVIRNPVICAKSLSTLDILSSGRLFVGIGPGSHKADYAARGIAFEERWGRFSEGLEILSSLLTEKSLDYAGTHYRLEKVSVKPAALQKSRPPIFVGSWGSVSFEESCSIRRRLDGFCLQHNHRRFQGEVESVAVLQEISRQGCRVISQFSSINVRIHFK